MASIIFMYSAHQSLTLNNLRYNICIATWSYSSLHHLKIKVQPLKGKLWETSREKPLFRSVRRQWGVQMCLKVFTPRPVAGWGCLMFSPLESLPTSETGRSKEHRGRCCVTLRPGLKGMQLLPLSLEHLCWSPELPYSQCCLRAAML